MLPGKLPPVLDPCCGSRMMYFDKKDPRILFCDNRSLETTLCDGRRLLIQPDIICDFRDLPFPTEAFRAVTFDPPHLLSGGDQSWIIKKYGRLPRLYWKEYLHAGFAECWRVLAPGGTLIFKWSEEQIPLGEITHLFPANPIYGNLARGNRQIFLVFFKHGPNTRILHPANRKDKDPSEKKNTYDLTILSPNLPDGTPWRETLPELIRKHYFLTRPGGTLILQSKLPGKNQKELLALLSEGMHPLFGNRAKSDPNLFWVFFRA